MFLKETSFHSPPSVVGTKVSLPTQTNSHLPSPCLYFFHLHTPLSSRLFSLPFSRKRRPKPFTLSFGGLARLPRRKESPRPDPAQTAASAQLLNKESVPCQPESHRMWGLLLFLVAGERPEESQGAFHWKTDCEQLRCGHELYKCLAQSEDRDPKAKIAGSEVSLHTTTAASKLYSPHQPAHLYFRLCGRCCI